MEESSGDQLAVESAPQAVEDYRGIEAGARQSDSLTYSNVAIAKPLTRVSSVHEKQTALKFSALLCQI